ncbi:cytochrome P450 [Streptomyces sp. NPDC059788]|uniref:cytochrome P450 n=1 Tax=Streptomyces sp. NPDC059788 TaxID=3346948 RepID=UPI00364C3033
MSSLPMPDRTPDLPLDYPFPRGPLGTPPPLVHWARAHRPVCPVVLPSGTRAWMITRKDDIAAVLADRRFTRDLTVARRSGEGGGAAPRIVGDDFTSVPGSIFNVDAPDHTRIRRVIAPYYTRSRIERQRPLVAALVDAAVAAMAERAGSCDLLEAFAAPLPSRIVCALLDVPPTVREAFVDSFTVHTSFGTDRAVVEAATRRTAALARQVVEVRRGLADDPRDDPVGALMSACDHGTVTEEELLGTASFLMITGAESLVSPLSLGPLTLMRHPAQLRACRADPRLWSRAAEEVLRYHHNGVLGLPRIALEDVELHGVTIRRGDAVCATMLGATWDPAHYRDPAAFDIHRTENADPTFGAGPHYCIGANQARMILTVAYQRLFDRFGSLEPAVPAGDIPWDEDSMFIRPAALPVVWRDGA